MCWLHLDEILIIKEELGFGHGIDCSKLDWQVSEHTLCHREYNSLVDHEPLWGLVVARQQSCLATEVVGDFKDNVEGLALSTGS